MTVIRAKKVKGKTYFYLIKGVRENGKVRQEIPKYSGPCHRFVIAKTTIQRENVIGAG